MDRGRVIDEQVRSGRPDDAAPVGQQDGNQAAEDADRAPHGIHRIQDAGHVPALYK